MSETIFTYGLLVDADPGPGILHILTGVIASYKLPREIVVVPAVERTPAGKADYKWAKAVAETHRTSS